MHLLLIEDDLDLGRGLQGALKLQGISSEWLRRADRAQPRLVDVQRPAQRFQALREAALGHHGAGLRASSRGEGLEHEVVGATVQAGQAVFQRGAHGDDDHRHRAAVAPPARQQLEAAASGQQEVEQHAVELPRLRTALACSGLKRQQAA